MALFYLAAEGLIRVKNMLFCIWNLFLNPLLTLLIALLSSCFFFFSQSDTFQLGFNLAIWHRRADVTVMSPSNPFTTVSRLWDQRLHQARKALAAVECNAVICWLLGIWVRAAGVHFRSCSVAGTDRVQWPGSHFWKRKLNIWIYNQTVLFLTCLLPPFLVLYISASCLADTNVICFG